MEEQEREKGASVPVESNLSFDPNASPRWIDSTMSNQTFGQHAVGLSFNPSGDDAVGVAKQTMAGAIDQMNDLRNHPEATAGQKRHASTAITMLEDAQMRMVKALTWKEPTQ